MALDLQKLWTSYPVLAIDFETTSAEPTSCEPVEVAAVRFECGAIVGRFSTLLRTTAPIPDDATLVHGITDADVAKAPVLEEVAHEIAALSVDAVPLAFNRRFDRTIMHRYLDGNDVTAFDHEQQWLCPYAMAWKKDKELRTANGGYARHSLAACCERRGIRVIGAHRAEGDAISAGTLFYSIMSGAKQPTLAALLESISTIEIEIDEHWEGIRKYKSEKERLIWRQYACAALQGHTAGQAAAIADELLALEKERYL